MFWNKLYRNNLKNREFDQEAPRNLCSERACKTRKVVILKLSAGLTTDPDHFAGIRKMVLRIISRLFTRLYGFLIAFLKSLQCEYPKHGCRSLALQYSTPCWLSFFNDSNDRLVDEGRELLDCSIKHISGDFVRILDRNFNTIVEFFSNRMFGLCLIAANP
jgi:hypothetical protein